MPPQGLPSVRDSELASELERLSKGGHDVLLTANKYTVCLWQRASGSAPWQSVCYGEFGKKSQAVASTKLRRRLLWAQVDAPPWDIDPTTAHAQIAVAKDLKAWLRDATGVTGREGDATAEIKDVLPYLAGWRCQFTGCGRDLRRHQASGDMGRFGYFAHIIAASPDGPRGHPTRSRELASDLSNFMLLCDECHRMIDKVQPASYPAELLQRMREDSIAEVKGLLDSLAYKAAEVVGVIGNIAGQPAPFHMDDAREALRGARLRTDQGKPDRYFDPGSGQHEVHSASYWLGLFKVLERDLPALRGVLAGTRTGSTRPRIALFPLHSTSVLVLTGRVLGDTSGLHIFQPHRNTVGTGTRWAWPKDAPSPADGKYRCEVVNQFSPGQTEAVLMVLLTSDIAPGRLPPSCVAAGQLRLPTIRVVGPTFDKECIQTPEDLQLLGNVVDDAVRKLQDEWRVHKVHLIVCAPASAAVVVGQKMQARHHADYVVYEAHPWKDTCFQPTIEITTTHIRELVSGLGTALPLQS
ncbi:hypothetical protein CNO08_12270 [Lysobacter capsici]|nr:hypothetical protein CNO08_12270 [Lysobacter capsici]